MSVHGEKIVWAAAKNKLQNCWINSRQVNKPIPYGRGAQDIARQVKGETGSATPLEQLETEIEQMMETWKTVSYVDAWKYMCECSDAVTNPGYIITPWGRKRRFPRVKDDALINGMQREAQNFPIQSTVADTCMIAMLRMKQYREKHGLHFRIINQIHDAVMVEAPTSEIEATKIMFRDTMANIQIPVANSEPLVLGIDIAILDRWGQKRKTEE